MQNMVNNGTVSLGCATDKKQKEEDIKMFNVVWKTKPIKGMTQTLVEHFTLT